MNNYKEMLVGKTITDVQTVFSEGRLQDINFTFSDGTRVSLVYETEPRCNAYLFRDEKDNGVIMPVQSEVLPKIQGIIYLGCERCKAVSGLCDSHNAEYHRLPRKPILKSTVLPPG